MDKLQNAEYLAPQVEVMELRAQGIICQSDFTVTNPFPDDDETIW